MILGKMHVLQELGVHPHKIPISSQSGSLDADSVPFGAWLCEVWFYIILRISRFIVKSKQGFQ